MSIQFTERPVSNGVILQMAGDLTYANREQFKGLEAGAAAYLRKPVVEEALVAAVASAVGAGAESAITEPWLQQ